VDILVSVPGRRRVSSIGFLHPCAYGRLREFEILGHLADALAAGSYEFDHLGLVLVGEVAALPSLVLVLGHLDPHSLLCWGCPPNRGSSIAHRPDLLEPNDAADITGPSQTRPWIATVRASRL